MDSTNNDIAVIGIAGRFPGANNVDEFWKNLLDGKDSITHFTDDQLAANVKNYDLLKDNPDYIKARGILENIDMFDAAFFGINPNEAKTTDPQHRVWKETVWEALENAACNPFEFKGSIGVFTGTAPNTYLHNHILKSEAERDKFNSTYSMEAFQLLINNNPGFLPTKTAYKFNLRGPAINVQTACSTSLVAIAQACQSLFCFESDICIAGGICIDLPQESGYLYQKGAITSSDGFCRPFDINSSGTVASNGVGVVILKRVEEAIDDRDHIYAVIKGWAINNDGGNKVSYMAPSVEGQAEAIMMAQAIAEIHPEDIGYVEAHGTATPLGDPIEIAGLTKAFSEKTDKKQFCSIGSVKSNIGHVDVAAGVAGFIKSSLIAHYKIIPASIHYTGPNSNIDFTSTPFFVQKEKSIWESEKLLNIGVSSFGIGGTNAHVVLQQPPVVINREYKQERPNLVLLSAKSEYSLQKRKTDILDFIRNHRQTNLTELAATLQTGRSHMPYKSFAVVKDSESLVSESALKNFTDSYNREGNKPLVFMFPGQGAQFVNMGLTLYKNEPLCQPIFNTCFSVFKKETGIDLKEILFTEEANEVSEKLLSRTEFTQPALFITEYAVAIFLVFFGIQPEVLIGHSIGEYTAACLSGVFDLEDALKIVIKRGQLMQKMPGGSMLAVKTTLENILSLKDVPFEVATINAPDLCVVSVEFQNVERVEETLKKSGYEYVLLNTSHAFHSAAFEPILDEFAEYVRKFRLNKPEIPFISCLTGECISAEMATDPHYWAKQLRNAVQFCKGIETITDSIDPIFIEVGPNTHLTSLVRRNSEKTLKSAIIPTLGKPTSQDDQSKMVATLGRLWANGAPIDFEKFYQERPNRIVLPTYPFDRKRYWIDRILANDTFRQEEPIGVEKDYRSPGIVALETDKKDKGNPNQTTTSVLKELLSGLVGFEPETIKTDITFSDMGMESLFLTQYAQIIEKKFRITIEFRQLVHDYPTLNSLAGYIDSQITTSKAEENPAKETSHKTYRNFIPFKPGGAIAPLVFVHGDNCDTFLQNQLGDEQPYLGFLHLGSDGEKYGFNSVESLADFYLDQLLRYKPDGPFILGGHSFGGIIAYEMAVRLVKRGFRIPLLILSDSVLIRRYRVLALKHGLKARFNDMLKWNYCNLILTIKKRLPVRLRNFYILNNYDKLADKYIPPTYSNRVLLLKATKNEFMANYLPWENFATNLSVVELEGGHNEIINNPATINKFVEAIKKEL
jgi:acyl transferase domain-containing protein/thioesterase domain-containing protein